MDFPVELQEKLLDLHRALESISSAMKVVTDKKPQEIREKLEPLDKAKFDLVCAYVLNSLFWIYLNTKGENPRDHAIKQELERIQSYMTKVKQQMDKAKAPKLDKEPVKRMLRNSLWTPKNKEKEAADSSSEIEVIEVLPSDNTTPKREFPDKARHSRKKHKKNN